MRPERRRPLVVNLPPQAWDANRAAQALGEGPDPYWIDRAFDKAGLDFETIDPNSKPWNPLAGRHGVYMGIDPLRSLRVLLFRRRAALIITGSESPSLLIAALRRLLFFSPKVIIWELSWSPGWRFREWVSQKSVPHVDCTIVVGRNQLELVRHEYGPNANPVFAPLYTDTDFFSPQGEPTLNADAYILSVGYDKGRDFGLLIEATAGLGRGLKIKAGRHPITVDRARFPHVEIIERFLSFLEIRALYAHAAVVAIPTFATPNACGVTTLMEAMAMGKAVVVSENPALADYIPPAEAQAAVVVPIGDGNALRAAIADLLLNPQKAKEIGQRARAFAVERFHPEPNLKIMTDVCWDMVAGSHLDTRPVTRDGVAANR
jgi:glycosyltransferase involved in cell wall biosynthesis